MIRFTNIILFLCSQNTIDTRYNQTILNLKQLVYNTTIVKV